MRFVITASALTLVAASVQAQDVMFHVGYIRTRTLGTEVQVRERGTFTFAPLGHRRVDREIDGERLAEVAIPAIVASDGVLFVIDHNHREARRAPVNVGTGGETSALQSEGELLTHVGEETRGPLTLHHSRSETADGTIVDLWDYRFPDPVVAGSRGITLAATWRGTASDGTPEVDERRIQSVVELTFDPDIFDSVPPGYRAEGVWRHPHSQRTLPGGRHGSGCGTSINRSLLPAARISPGSRESRTLRRTARQRPGLGPARRDPTVRWSLSAAGGCDDCPGETDHEPKARCGMTRPRGRLASQVAPAASDRRRVTLTRHEAPVAVERRVLPHQGRGAPRQRPAGTAPAPPAGPKADRGRANVDATRDSGRPDIPPRRGPRGGGEVGSGRGRGRPVVGRARGCRRRADGARKAPPADRPNSPRRGPPPRSPPRTPPPARQAIRKGRTQPPGAAR